MARASFSTLPLELKARIVEMTSDQEDAWRRRVKKAERAAAHINSLSALALVSRELRDLAAKHQFRVLSADRASLSVFRFRVLPRYGHLITTIRFYNSHAKEGSEYALSITGQLPALRSLAFQAGAATRLFGSGVTLKDDLEDEEASDRGSILKFLSPRIEALKLFDFEPSEAVGLVRACRNLKTLGLVRLREDTEQDKGPESLVPAIMSLARLDNLSISLHGTATRWPIATLVPLEAGDLYLPSIKCLQLAFVPVNEETFRIVSNFSSTIETLTLEFRSPTPTGTASLPPPLDLPRLTTLNICVQKLPHFDYIHRILLSTTTLSHFTLSRSNSADLDLTEPALVSVLDSQRVLRGVRLGGALCYSPLTSKTPKKGFPSPSSLAAYSRLVHSRGLDPSVLDRPHLTPFHPDAQLNYTENEVDFLEAVLGRTLTFGQLELKRMLAEGNVAKAVGWVAKLKALEEERLVWND